MSLSVVRAAFSVVSLPSLPLASLLLEAVSHTHRFDDPPNQLDKIQTWNRVSEQHPTTTTTTTKKKNHKNKKKYKQNGLRAFSTPTRIARPMSAILNVRFNRVRGAFIWRSLYRHEGERYSLFLTRVSYQEER